MRTASGSYTSLALRMGEIRRIASDPRGRRALESAVLAVRDPKNAARVFNLHGHPELKPLLGCRKAPTLEAALGQVIYSRGLSCHLFSRRTPRGLGLCALFPGGRESALACAGGDQGLDPTSQFEQDHRQARLRHRECRKRRRGEATALQQAAAPAKKRRSARRSPMERALVQAVAEDFRARVAVGSYFLYLPVAYGPAHDKKVCPCLPRPRGRRPHPPTSWAQTARNCGPSPPPPRGGATDGLLSAREFEASG